MNIILGLCSESGISSWVSYFNINHYINRWSVCILVEILFSFRASNIGLVISIAYKSSNLIYKTSILRQLNMKTISIIESHQILIRGNHIDTRITNILVIPASLFLINNYNLIHFEIIYLLYYFYNKSIY